jgi:hypothetical protein
VDPRWTLTQPDHPLQASLYLSDEPPMVPWCAGTNAGNSGTGEAAFTMQSSTVTKTASETFISG